MRLGISFRIPVRSIQRRRYPKRPIYPTYQQNYPMPPTFRELDKIYPMLEKPDRVDRLKILLFVCAAILSLLAVVIVSLMVSYN